MLNLIRKELIRRWRSPLATIAMLVFPFMMAGMIGMISGGAGSSAQFPVIDVLCRHNTAGNQYEKGVTDVPLSTQHLAGIVRARDGRVTQLRHCVFREGVAKCAPQRHGWR